MNLQTLGWNQYFEEAFKEYKEQGYEVGRVILEHKRIYRVLTEKGELLAEVSGKMRFRALERQDYPAVGDWVVLTPRYEENKATIHDILPRKSKFSRKVAGMTTEEQIVATNVDTIFLVNALNADFNIRRIERYVLTAWESGANPVIILSKSDLCEDIKEKIAQVESVTFGVPIHAISAEQNIGMDQLAPYVYEGQTIALLGSSGVGKSTLTNALLGSTKQEVQTVREGDDRGRHTTTHRELVILDKGGILIDTPGMRELQLWEADEGFSQSFSDVEALAENCRFRDCSHMKEPGCAIQEAIEDGTLERDRYNSYVKLQKELAFLERKENKRAALLEKAKWKKITSTQKKSKR
ncbi:ribosome small subunit-dependent GTPase A [Heyndrickxia oleronia]|uniref:ribosome small subunit-dependent GTPase A n=1 Tax=Heyndrickxia oleronia TaxID=38875 RepID=UPI00203E90F3|nr:ribosome small subunit-dependent GTPase A [Heyndrickxia oleronia]MCM3239810.1 ribosome small subunit-dependent GTPase A [Heyndrickxia oleronia]